MYNYVLEELICEQFVIVIQYILSMYCSDWSPVLLLSGAQMALLLLPVLLLLLQ